MDLIPDIPIPTQNKLIPDPILTPAKSGINTALAQIIRLIGVRKVEVGQDDTYTQLKNNSMMVE